MNHSTGHLMVRGRRLLGRTGFVIAATAFVASCSCVPLNPPNGGGTTTTTEATTTTVYPGGSTTTTTEPGGSTTTTTEPGGSTTTTTEPGGSTTTTTVAGGGGPGDVVDVDTLDARDCIVPTDDSTFVAEVVLKKCDEPHDMEVADVFEIARDFYPDESYPGSNRLVPDAYEACQPRFEDYTGEDFWESEFDLTTITPSPSTWEDGDRTIVCLVVNIDRSPLTSPVFQG